MTPLSNTHLSLPPLLSECRHQYQLPDDTMRINASAFRYVYDEVQVADGLDLVIGVDYRWIDDRFLEATNQVFDKSDDYWVANMRVALASEKWEVAVYGTNLFDEDYLTYINNIGFFKLDVFGERQTFGASVRYRFQ